MVPKTRNETILSNQDHYEVIVVQFVNTILPLLQIYLQKLFDSKEVMIDEVSEEVESDG